MEEMFSDFSDFIRTEKGIITLFREIEECPDNMDNMDNMDNVDLEIIGFSRNKENLEIDNIFKHCTDSDGGFISNIYNNTKIRHIDVSSNISSNQFANDLRIIYNEWQITHQQPFCMRINANSESSRLSIFRA